MKEEAKPHDEFAPAETKTKDDQSQSKEKETKGDEKSNGTAPGGSWDDLLFQWIQSYNPKLLLNLLNSP